LITICFQEINQRMSFARGCEEIVCIVKPAREGFNNFAANFVTARPSRGANRHSHISGSHIVFSGQTLESLDCDSRQRPAPARMHCGK
jgi:trehalose-6-phosphate synthase